MSSESSLAFIALGSNLGNSREVLERAIQKLQELSEDRVRRSSCWKTTPVDCPPGSGEFINAAVALKVREGETAEGLLRKLHGLEKEFGRAPKKVMNEARPLDLDLIAFGSEIRNSKELILPHPRAHLRRFVLAPLNEIAPDLIFPGQKKTVRELLANLRTDEIVEKF
jgi:2-amino-4-hydroxy-6-hydroxymethyldihydropteridine diphosphokinase